MSNLTKKQDKTVSTTSKHSSKVVSAASVGAVQHYDRGRAKQTVILSHAAIKPESNMTALEKMQLARSGISKHDLEQLKQTTGLDYDSLAKGLAVTKATLFSKKGEEKFSADLSEKIVSLADIYSYGYAVFEDVAHFNAWMHRPNEALGGQAPYAIMDNQFGREEVKDLIGRIEYGVYS
jgi:putative toxin-antitoxin system antitoxin component (TIGR02293 family)